ncbi:acyl-CoA thioesterase [Endothiovibrio diazotrophicus]
MSLHTHRFHVALHDTDAAGVLFFAHLLRHAHDAYEGLMAAGGMPLAGVVAEGAFHLPIVHCEADYRAPLRHGDKVAVAVTVARVGESAFTLRYRFTAGGEEAAAATTVHVALDPASRAKRPLPAPLRALLAAGARGEAAL